MRPKRDYRPRPKLFQKQSRYKVRGRSSSAAAMLAATARLAFIGNQGHVFAGAHTKARFPRRCARPGINSGCGEPNFIYLILLELGVFSRASVRVSLSINCLLGRAKFCHEVQAWRVLPSGMDSSRFIGPPNFAGENAEKAGTWPPPLVTLARPGGR